MSKLIGLPESCNVNPTIKHNDAQFPHTSAIPCNHSVLLKENYLSEFLTKTEKERVLKNLGINSSIEWGEIGGFIEKLPDLLEKLKKYILKEKEGNTAVEQIAYTNEEYPTITSLKEALDTILYKDLTINLSTDPSIWGETFCGNINTNYILPLQKYTVKWSYNKEIKELWLNNEKIDPLIRQKIFLSDEGFRESLNITLMASDGIKTISKTITLRFCPIIGYDLQSKKEHDDHALEGYILNPSKPCTFTVPSPSYTDDEGIYIFVSIPKSWNTSPKFTINGFTGGFSLQTDNDLYTVWVSDNPNLGTTTITVS